MDASIRALNLICAAMRPFSRRGQHQQTFLRMHQHIADAARAPSFLKLHRRDSAQNGVISDDTQHGFLLFAVLRIGQAASAERIASIRKLHGAEPLQPIRRGTG